MKIRIVSLREAGANFARRMSFWHEWFAWYPVKVAHGEYRWLEVVERRFINSHWRYQALNRFSD